MLVNYWSNFKDWILPKICVCCGLNHNDTMLDLCAVCKTNLPWAINRCYKCGLQLTPNTTTLYCEHCDHNPEIFNRLCCLFAYEPPIDIFITQLKFSKRLALTQWLADLLAQSIIAKWYTTQSLPEIIIPVPLHPARQRQRGYNQALEISAPLAQHLNIPVRENLCARVRHTRQQSRLNKTQRKHNTNNAFVAQPLTYKHVAILDDVVTTGNTLRALAKALHAAGVENIDVWCLARA